MHSNDSVKPHYRVRLKNEVLLVCGFNYPRDLALRYLVIVPVS